MWDPDSREVENLFYSSIEFVRIFCTVSCAIVLLQNVLGSDLVRMILSHDFLFVNWAIIRLDFILSFPENVTFDIKERTSEDDSLGKLNAMMVQRQFRKS